ncbi:MAG: four helix bundle protein [Acutalibacteraceae bacterium]
MAWQSYKELIVWQKSMDLVDEVYRLIKKLPREELYALSDQMRRSAISIPSNIAEGHSRHSAKEFRHFLSISKGSASELETQLLICIRQKYLSEPQTHTALGLCDEISRILAKIIMNTN